MENNSILSQQHIHPYPKSVSYSLEYQRDHFWRCSYTSSISQAQHYKIVLPLYVKPVFLKPTAIQGLGLTMIGLYRTTEEKSYLEVVVAYENLSNEINCSDWLYYKLDLMGEEVIDKREWVDESGGYSDVLTKKIYNN